MTTDLTTHVTASVAELGKLLAPAGFKTTRNDFFAHPAPVGIDVSAAGYRITCKMNVGAWPTHIDMPIDTRPAEVAHIALALVERAQIVKNAS